MKNKQGIRLGSIAGIEIRAELSWILVFIFIIWSLATGLFSSLLASHGQMYVISFSILATGLFFTSIVIHELAHSLVALHHDIPVQNITLFMFGGIASIEREPETPGSEFTIAFAGPISSIVLSLVCFALSGQFISGLSLQQVIEALFRIPVNVSPINLLLTWLGSLNFSLGVFNLMPGFPMDGGRLVRAILWKLSGNVVKATAIASSMGKLVALSFIGFGIFSIVGLSQALQFSNLYSSFWMILIGGFLYTAAQRSYQYVLVREALGSLPVAEIMDQRVYPIFQTSRVREIIAIDSWQLVTSFAVVNDEQELVGLLYPKDIAVLDTDLLNKRVSDIMTPIEDVPNIAIDEKASHAYLRLDNYTHSHLPVFENDSLRGTISLKDILLWIKKRENILG